MERNDKKARPLAAGLAAGIFWGLMVFFTTLFMAGFPGYGNTFGELLASVYPGYSVSLAGSVVGLFYGLAEGFIAGMVVVWLYNRFV